MLYQCHLRLGKFHHSDTIDTTEMKVDYELQKIIMMIPNSLKKVELNNLETLTLQSVWFLGFKIKKDHLLEKNLYSCFLCFGDS